MTTNSTYEEVKIKLPTELYDAIFDIIEEGLVGVVRKGTQAVKKGLPALLLKLPFAAKAAAASVTLIGGGIAYVFSSSRKRKKAKAKESEQIPPTVDEFNTSLKDYINAGKNGTMTQSEIDNLLLAMKNLNSFDIDGNVTINLSTDQLNTLVSSIYEYTKQITKTDEEQENPYSLAVISNTPEEKFKELHQCLEIQREIFSNKE